MNFPTGLKCVVKMRPPQTQNHDDGCIKDRDDLFVKNTSRLPVRYSLVPRAGGRLARYNKDKQIKIKC